MVKKIIAMLMTLLLIASAGMGAFAISAEQLDSLLSYAVDAGKSTFVAALPYICSDYGINMLKDSLDTYLSGGDAGLFQGVFESLTERVEGETIKKLLNSLKYVDQDVRESVQKTCQSNLST